MRLVARNSVVYVLNRDGFSRCRSGELDTKNGGSLEVSISQSGWRSKVGYRKCGQANGRHVRRDIKYVILHLLGPFWLTGTEEGCRLSQDRRSNDGPSYSPVRRDRAFQDVRHETVACGCSRLLLLAVRWGTCQRRTSPSKRKRKT